MKDKILYLISCISDRKKECVTLLIWDVLSIFIVSVISIISVKFVCFLLNYLNFNLGLKLVTVLYWFIIIWFIVAILVSIVFHIKTIYLLNKNGRGALFKDEE